MKLSRQFLYKPEVAAGLVAVGHISHQILVGNILTRSSTRLVLEPRTVLYSFTVTDIRDTRALRILKSFLNLGLMCFMKVIDTETIAILFVFHSYFQLSEATRRQRVFYRHSGRDAVWLRARLQLLEVQYGHVDVSSRVSFQSRMMGYAWKSTGSSKKKKLDLIAALNFRNPKLAAQRLVPRNSAIGEGSPSVGVVF